MLTSTASDQATKNSIEEQEKSMNDIDKDAEPIDLSWVTTEPRYEGPVWMQWTLLISKIALMGIWGAIAIAVLVK